MFQGTTQETHYTRLYSCKHFRNRIIRLQTLCAKLNLDAIVLIIGIDTCHDEEMKKLQNWLLYGLSASDINGSPLSDAFNDSFVVVSKDSFQAYTNSAGFKQHLSNLTTLLTNCNIYTITKADESDTESSEVIKVSKFYEMIHDKKVIGMPVRRLVLNDYVANESQMLEKWPLIQAYGLDMVGGGFFTMKHNFHNVRDDLDQMYKEYDSFAVYRMVYDEIDRLNQHYYDNFFNFNRDTPIKRLENRTEYDLIESFQLRYEVSLLTKKAGHTIATSDGLPLPRALFGLNTNKEFSELSSKEDRLYKYNAKHNDQTQHMTVEFVEKNTSLRFARTYFLSSMSQHYMQGIRFYQNDDDTELTNPNGRAIEQGARVLLNAYISLILTFNATQELLLRGGVKSEQELHSVSFAQFSKIFTTRVGVNEIGKIIENGKDDWFAQAKAYDSMGNEVPLFGEKALLPMEKKLIVLRLQARNILNQQQQMGAEGTNLGSVIFADTFFQLDIQQGQDTVINLTKNVPALQLWHTTNKHYEHLPKPILTEKNLYCDYLGERLNYYQDLTGIIPIKDTYQDIFQQTDLNLWGVKIVFYEKGMIVVDSRIGCGVLLYENLEKIVFHTANDQWMEIRVKPEGQTMLPANMICENVIYLKINNNIVNEKYKAFKAMKLAETLPENLKIERSFDPCQHLLDSQSLRNFEVNQKYNKAYSCDYQNFEFVEPVYRELLEYHTIGEFNQIRAKEFIGFSSFHSVYSEAYKKQPFITNYAQLMVEKLKSGEPAGRSNVIIVSGIPGSGKSKFTESLAKQLAAEGLPSFSFKQPGHISENVKFSTQKFITQILQFREQTLSGSKKYGSPLCIVAVLPSYNHLKKIIFELKKSQEFNAAFDIKHIITKVSARNFYMNKNRNTFQFLIENCMKGVAHAIVFERPTNISQQEIELMQRALSNANFEQNVLPVPGKSFKLEDLAKILIHSSFYQDKLNILYNKYFYGFEKEGKSSYFQEKAVQGFYLPFRYPFREDLLDSTLMLALNVPISDIESLRPRDLEAEKREKEDKENKIKAEMAQMNREQLRKKEKEIKEKKKIEADLEPERVLREEMDRVKRKVLSQNDIYIERFRGYVVIEGKEEEQNYELICNFNEISLRPMKNQGKMMKSEDLGFVIYGRNINSPNSENLLKELLKCGRTQLKQKKSLKSRETITEEEIEMLKDKYVSSMLPDGWFFNGYMYLNYDGIQQPEHPNLELIIKTYLDDQNSQIGDYNREVQKEWRNDLTKYDKPQQQLATV